MAGLGIAQTPRKRPLTHADADSWRSITNQQLSPDGRWVAFGLFPQEGDGEVVVRNLRTGEERRQPAGARPQPPARPTREIVPGGSSEPQSIRLSFSAGSRVVVFTTFPPKDQVDTARKEKKKAAEMPKGGLVIWELSGAPVRIGRVKGFQLPEKADGLVAYHKEPVKAEETQEGASGRSRPPEFGSDLVLRKLADSSERVFAGVTEYSLSKDGQTLVYAVSSRDKRESNGVYAVATSGGEPAALASGPGRYTRLTWDERQSRLAFLSRPEKGRPRLCLWERGQTAAREVVGDGTPGMRDGFAVSGDGTVSFSRDGRRVFFGCGRPRPESSKEAAAEERPRYDLWHWRDDFIQPMQKVRAENEHKRSYRAVFHLDQSKLVQLADETMAEATPNPQGTWALGADDRAYRRVLEYDRRYSDYYLVNTAGGDRRPILSRVAGSPSWSVDGRYLLVFDNDHWSTISLDGRRTELTAKLGVSFADERNDRPEPAGSYGVGGWTRDGRWVLLYDRYDIWQAAPDGSAAKNLTDAVGRKERIEFRLVRLRDEPDEPGIDASQPLLLRAESELTRETGFWRDRVDSNQPPHKLVMAARYLTAPSKARGAQRLLLTASTFNTFPDLVVSDPDFREMRRASDANPQKAGLLWGTGELIPFRNQDGVPLAAALYKPENFDPGRKYPLLVYIYERLSQNLHRFVDPRPGQNINFAYYTSNGYLVLAPDIVYTIGYPGPSALKCVLPAIQAVADRGWVDESAIGIQGHSWGGYQIAYLLTQTNRFRAAAAGAPVANMFSAYNGIRWGPGIPRQFQYERNQSRIGGTPWEYPMRFLDNSPIFRADRVSTPLLMVHNDQDDAVPWYQGIEFYLALRRLGKEVYLFNYNGEYHGLRRRANQKDYSVRLQQFFDHYLKGAARPAWMERGEPFLEKDTAR